MQSPASFPFVPGIMLQIGAGYLSATECKKPVLVTIQASDERLHEAARRDRSRGRRRQDARRRPRADRDDRLGSDRRAGRGEQPDCVMAFMSESLNSVFDPALKQTGWKGPFAREQAHRLPGRRLHPEDPRLVPGSDGRPRRSRLLAAVQRPEVGQVQRLHRVALGREPREPDLELHEGLLPELHRVDQHREARRRFRSAGRQRHDLGRARGRGHDRHERVHGPVQHEEQRGLPGLAAPLQHQAGDRGGARRQGRDPATTASSSISDRTSSPSSSSSSRDRSRHPIPGCRDLHRTIPILGAVKAAE